METRGTDSSTTRQYNDPVNSEAALNLCLQLWQQGGLNANKAALLLAAVPALRSLLQPIIQPKKNDAETDIVSAFSLTAPLLDAFNDLSQSGEWQLALLGLNPDVRQHWINLAAARCQEAGTMSDTMVLVKLIQQLGNASEWVLAQLESTATTPQIIAGPLAQTERDLLGHSLNDNAAIPALCRILRTSYTLFTVSEQNEPPAPIQAVDVTAKQLTNNWCSGRLLALPNTLLDEHNLKPNADWLLVSRSGHDNMPLTELFAQQPWLFLLSLIIFVQDAWAAEQRGGLLLTLPAGQNAFAPGQINVAVQGIEGDEVSLGSLAEFLVLLLGELNIPLYPALDANTESINRLNRVLSSFIAELLAKKIWQFTEAGRGEAGQYRIHTSFSDACYSLPLAPLFGYKSQTLQRTIKQLAQNCYANKKRAANRINLQGSSL
ncbi:hypothetical protein FIF84_002230 [Escherichia coli]|jgi:hypothetical protein|uniref:Uncharacterized protein n=4 Tax=Escherichia coli TaxID=562 RepID=A0A1L4ITW0_ECOLX|nr:MULTISPECIES: hypothetical protein [Enterobacteriaceae]EEY4450095.1 hypothetical protein [Escherichia coli O130]EEZ6107010.1 hypothetical protein [Escherichia coli O86]EFA4161860.1 hypothetical protein [Escherichia coli O174:H7]EFA4195701.1 hypothetical protein [Escherichia coli O132]EFN6682545.1 hypothetical protein [Escherichia coli O179:H8]EFN8586191.1 hypothetical protein [Escherichia coli O8:H21]EFO3117431.1 hypothetical protein [Escherichia coli O8]EIK3326029.1 hypothetical protein